MLAVMAASQARAEDKYQFGLFLNGEKEMGSNVHLTYHVGWANFAGTTLPYMYLGADKRFTDNFSLEAMLGYGFEVIPENSGPVYALAPVFKFGKWSFYNDLEYWSGSSCLFTVHALTYPVGPVRVGLDERTFYYFDQEDAAARTFRVGPSLRIPFSDHAQVGLFYFYSFENDGQDANVINMSLNFNF